MAAAMSAFAAIAPVRAGSAAVAPAMRSTSATPARTVQKASASLGRSSIFGQTIAPAKLTASSGRSFLSFAKKTTECKVDVGDKMPALTLPDENGKSVTVPTNKKVVLFFYPAADTPGCTKEACSFRDQYAAFTSAGAAVFGVSGDSPSKQKAFKAKYNLPYTLLCDEGNKTRQAWGIPADLFGALQGRQTYVVDKGVVKLVFNNQFQPEKHIEEALKVIKA
eukprot:jgi/Mesvir1/28176/Mv04736-RA.1